MTYKGTIYQNQNRDFQLCVWLHLPLFVKDFQILFPNTLMYIVAQIQNMRGFHLLLRDWYVSSFERA